MKDIPTVVYNFKASRSHFQLSTIRRGSSLLVPENVASRYRELALLMRYLMSLVDSTTVH